MTVWYEFRLLNCQTLAIHLELYNLLPYFIFICACHLRNVFMSLHRSTAEYENAPFQNYLTKEWKVSRVKSYNAYQSPLLEGETLSRASYCSEMLPGFIGLL